jgi:hypothetical protein
VGVVRQDLGEGERVVHLALPDEVPGRDDRRPTLPRARRAREPVERPPRLVREVPAHHPRRGAVDEVPVVDAVVPPQVQRVEFAPARLGRARGPGLPVHDAHRPYADLVDGVLEQALDLRRLHGGTRPGEGEHLAHRHAHVQLVLPTPPPLAVVTALGHRA